MNIEKKNLPTIQNNSLFYLNEPSSFARNFLYYIIGIGHFYTTTQYLETRTDNAYDSFLIMYVLDGMLQIETNGQSYDAPARSIVLIDCYKKHSYKALAPTEFAYLHFDGSNSRAFFNELTRSRGSVFQDECFPAHYNAILQLSNEIDQGRMPAEGEVSVLIHKLLCELCKNSAIKYAFKYSPMILKALNFIGNHFTSDITVDEIAAHCNFSPQHFSRLFKKETGVTPYSYVLEKRISFACELLSDSDDTVKQIAEKIGYSSAVNFMNEFKRRFALSPSEYRRKNRKNK
ncbi:MAG: helix-turn-helix transcriptional regulator [Clostridia bacterium]|nr:helix-turn-helix transcriptional regulator [Clostridia bacterium]